MRRESDSRIPLIDEREQGEGRPEVRRDRPLKMQNCSGYLLFHALIRVENTVSIYSPIDNMLYNIL